MASQTSDGLNHAVSGHKYTNVWLIADETADRSEVLRLLSGWGYRIVPLAPDSPSYDLDLSEPVVAVSTMVDWSLPECDVWKATCQQNNGAVLVLSRPPYTTPEDIEQVHAALKPAFPSSFYSVNMATLHPDEVSVKMAMLMEQPVPATPLTVSLETFGFRYGVPKGDVRPPDWVMDVRFLPNPYYDPELRPLNGQDLPVAGFLTEQSVTSPFFHHLEQMLLAMIPAYYNEGKRQLYLAIGCTGGQHRSVFVAEHLHQYLQQQLPVALASLCPNVTVTLHHREEPHWRK